ncbi:MAG: hypothetical protein ACC657_17575, partial [Thiohalomonadales bacterium]
RKFAIIFCTRSANIILSSKAIHQTKAYPVTVYIRRFYKKRLCEDGTPVDAEFYNYRLINKGNTT